MATAPDPDDLQLCVLVRQQQLLTDEQLEAALEKWFAGPPRPLLELLAEEASLSAGQVALLKTTLSRRSADTVGGASDSRLRTLPAAVQRLLTSAGERTGMATRKPFETLPHDPTRSAAARSQAAGMTPGERFEILQIHAQGGLGVVYQARDREIDRTVALKQIKSKWADDEDARARFLLEARVTGRLEHPNVAPVYALGADETGRPYYAMRFIRGESLLEVIDRFHHGRNAHLSPVKRMPELRKLLQRFLDVCNAVDYAHSKGVIHRDLKPANIMLGKFGETLVVDWGLAKVIGSDEDVALTTRMAPSLAGNAGLNETQMGAAIGTPAYMSPEQAGGRIAELGPPTDVFSLGATLYHLLTGYLPRDTDDDPGETIAKAQRQPVAPPRQRAPWLPRALDSICTKALAVAPHDRYISARALGDDVQRWLADEPVTAHREGWSEMAFRWARYHRTLAASLAAAYLAVTLAIVAAVLGSNYLRSGDRSGQSETPPPASAP